MDFLCLSCMAINLDTIFVSPDPVPSQGRPVAALGHITTESENSACQLCRLFAASRVGKDESTALSPEGNQSSYHLRAFSCLTKQHMRMTQLRVRQKPSIVLAVVPGPPKTTIDGLRSICLSNGLITRHSVADTAETGPWTFFGRRVPPKVNYSLLRSWDRRCRTQHLSVCKTSTIPGTNSLRVIDCVLKQVIRLPHYAEYITLSYVWGRYSGTSSCQNVSSGRSWSNFVIPKLIEDAMCVVRNLGYRYL